MEPNTPGKRKPRGTLNQFKCDCCRRDKQKCEPVHRVWPQRCTRCEYKGFDCSENTRKKRTTTARAAIQQDVGPHITTPQPLAAETVEGALPAPVADPDHDLESGESGIPENDVSKESDADRNLDQIINATSLFKLTRRASIKLATQESELESIFPDFNYNGESLASTYADSLDRFGSQLLSMISDALTALGHQSPYSTAKSFVLEQAICEIAADPSATHQSSLGISTSIATESRPGSLTYMVYKLGVCKLITKTIVGMLADNRPGRAIILLEDFVPSSSGEHMSGYELADLFWDSFRSLRKNFKQSPPPSWYWDLPKAITDNPGFFGDTSWIIRLQDFAEPQWHFRDCLGGLIHSLLDQLGRDEHQTISLNTRERLIKRIVTCVREDTRNIRDIWGQAPLHYAARYGLPDLITGLLVAGAANPNEASYRGHTPLHYAAAIGNVEICELLLSHGAGVNNLDLNGYTPLAYAARKGNSEVVRLLLDQDLVDPNIAPFRLPNPLATLANAVGTEDASFLS